MLITNGIILGKGRKANKQSIIDLITVSSNYRILGSLYYDVDYASESCINKGLGYLQTSPESFVEGCYLGT